jgi:hypothetical protein
MIHDVIYRPFHNVLRDYKNFLQENRRTHIYETCMVRKNNSKLFFPSKLFFIVVHISAASSEEYRCTHVDARVARTWISYRCVPCHPWCTHRTSLKLFQFSCGCEQFQYGRSFGFLVINVCNHGGHYEMPCILYWKVSYHFRFIHKYLSVEYFVIAVCKLFARAVLVASKGTEHAHTLYACYWGVPLRWLSGWSLCR